VDGVEIAERVLDGVRSDVAALQERHGVTPGLAVIVVGERPDSLKYVAKKEALAASLGLRSVKTVLPADCPQDTLLDTIETMNTDPDMDGILVQLPLPDHLGAKEALLAIDPKKDVDGFHPTNVGRLASWRESTLAPCTPRGVIHMLKQAGVELRGAHVAVVGNSNVVGQPLALLLLAERATVTVVHKDTRAPAALCRQADVVVSAAGVARLVTAEWGKPGATVIDVGINFAPDPERGDGKARMCGDVAPCVWGVAAAVR
jgi:methylenetetrahydrofolate dehydrogenase (NADP+)/methenyltetrahydrofolate cyclohydrolase